MLGRSLQDAYVPCEPIEGRDRSGVLAALDGRSRGDESIDHSGKGSVELRREKSQELLAHVQSEGRFASGLFGRGRLVTCELARLAQADRDLDDHDRLGEERGERKEVIAEDTDPSRWQEEDVRTHGRRHRGDQSRPATAVPRGDDHRRGKENEGMIRAEPAEDVLDPKGDCDGRDRDEVADQSARVTIHSNAAAYRHHSLESAR